MSGLSTVGPSLGLGEGGPSGLARGEVPTAVVTTAATVAHVLEKVPVPTLGGAAGKVGQMTELPGMEQRSFAQAGAALR